MVRVRQTYNFGRNKPKNNQGYSTITICIFLLIIGVVSLIVGMAMTLTKHHNRMMTPPDARDDTPTPNLKGGGTFQLENPNLNNINQVIQHQEPPPIISIEEKKVETVSSSSIYNMHATLMDSNDEFDFKQLIGKVSLIVNVASK